MAITRCPYCRAIIDEKDRFCTNCGTQLLYAEDAGVEEDEESQDKEAEEEVVLVEEPAETTGEGKVFRDLASVLLAEEAEEGPGEEAVEKAEPEEAKPRQVKREPRAERPRGPRQKALGFSPVEERADREPVLFPAGPPDAEPVKTEK